MKKTSGCVVLAALSGLAVSSIANAQTVETYRDSGQRLKAKRIAVNGKPVKPKKGQAGGGAADFPGAAVVYDNAPAAGSGQAYISFGGAPWTTLDACSFSGGTVSNPGALGPVVLTSLGGEIVTAPAADPGGQVFFQIDFWNTVDQTVPAGTSVTVGTTTIGSILYGATLGPNPFPTGGVAWIFGDDDITDLGFTIPDDNFGFQLTVFSSLNPNVLSTIYKPGFCSTVGGTLASGSSDLNFWADTNNNNILEPGEHYGATGYFCNLGLKLSGIHCYVNCDDSTSTPLLSANDFQCFLNAYAADSTLDDAGQISSYANCDHSTAPPALNANDFQCFLNAYAAGCPT